MTNNAARPLRTQEQRLVETMVGLDRDFIQKLKVVGSESSISFSGIGGAIGSSVPGKPQSPTGNYLAVAGGAMSGAIAFNVKVVQIDLTGSIDITPITGAYTSYIVASTHSGLTSDLQQIIGAHDDGQLLWIQAVATETITIKNDISGVGSGGFNIRTPALADFVLKGPQAVLLYFDPVSNQWAFHDSSFFDNISGGISGDLDMHNFKILNAGAIQFTNGGISDSTKRQIFCTSNYMAFEFPNINDSFRFNWNGITDLQFFRDRILPQYNLSGNFSTMTLGDSTHIWGSISVRTQQIYGEIAFIGPLANTGWLTSCYPFNDLGADLGVGSFGQFARWNNIFMGGQLFLYENILTNRALAIYKDIPTHDAIYDMIDPPGGSQGHSFQLNSVEWLRVFLGGAAINGVLNIAGNIQPNADSAYGCGVSASRFIMNGSMYLGIKKSAPTPSVIDLPSGYFAVFKDTRQIDGVGVSLFYNDNNAMVTVGLS